MEPVIMELERKETVVVVGHQAVLRFLEIILFKLLSTSWKVPFGIPSGDRRGANAMARGKQQTTSGCHTQLDRYLCTLL